MADLKLLALILLQATFGHQEFLAGHSGSSVHHEAEYVQKVELDTLKLEILTLQNANRRQDESIRRQDEAIRRQEETIGYLLKEMSRRDNIGELSTSAAAFSAYVSEVMDYDKGAVVRFDTVLTNIGGFYNNDLSVFQCPLNGLYLFSLSVESNHEHYMNAGIVKDGSLLLEAISDLSGYGQGSTTVLTECSASQAVWVECTQDDRQLEAWRQSSFSGVLITPYS